MYIQLYQRGQLRRHVMRKNIRGKSKERGLGWNSKSLPFNIQPCSANIFPFITFLNIHKQGPIHVCKKRMKNRYLDKAADGS
jgi:hypothetical protein